MACKWSSLVGTMPFKKKLENGVSLTYEQTVGQPKYKLLPHSIRELVAVEVWDPVEILVDNRVRTALKEVV